MRRKTEFSLCKMEMRAVCISLTVTPCSKRLVTMRYSKLFVPAGEQNAMKKARSNEMYQLESSGSLSILVPSSANVWEQPRCWRLKKSSSRHVGEPASSFVLMQGVLSFVWSLDAFPHCWLLFLFLFEAVMPSKLPPCLVWATQSFLGMARKE